MHPAATLQGIPIHTSHSTLQARRAHASSINSISNGASSVITFFQKNDSTVKKKKKREKKEREKNRSQETPRNKTILLDLIDI